MTNETREWKGVRMDKDSTMGHCFELWEQAKRISERGQEPWDTLWGAVTRGYEQALDAMAQIAKTRPWFDEKTHGKDEDR